MATFNACQSCGFDIANGFKFCGNCGKPVKNSAGISGLEITAERRNLILMFCDLVGSSALAERLDPEDMLQVINNYQTVCADIVGNYGGHVAQYLGDGILIYFGYPRAQDNDAERAVLCALDIQKAISDSSRIGGGRRSGSHCSAQWPGGGGPLGWTGQWPSIGHWRSPQLGGPPAKTGSAWRGGGLRVAAAAASGANHDPTDGTAPAQGH